MMKVIILAGGYGSRISSITKDMPKPMIRIGKKTILEHVMDTFIRYGHKDFHIALGYKSKVIKKYFNKKNFKKYSLYINGKTIRKNKNLNSIQLNLYDTGLNTMTGGRVKKILNKFNNKNENFFLTYGDGVGNINLYKLKKFHLKHKKLISITAVRPPARFGELIIRGSKVLKFQEKPQLQKGWINGGYFIINKKIEKYIYDSKIVFEREPIEKAAKTKNLMSFKHYDFWKCMDNLRDKNELDKLINLKTIPWLK